MKHYLFLILSLFIVFESYSQTEKKIDSLLNEALNYKKENQYNGALKCYLQAAKITNQDSPLFRKLHLDFGQFYYDWGLYDKAIENILQAGSFQTTSEENFKALKTLAMSYEKLKKYDMALMYYKDLNTRYNEKYQVKVRASLLVSIANIYKKTGQYNNATTFEIENLKLRKQLKDSVGMFVALNNLGASYRQLKEYNKALECLNQSYALSKQVGEEMQMGITLMNIGLIHQYLSNHEEAIKNLLAALAVFQKHKKNYEIGQVSNAIGAIYYVIEEYNSARKYALGALSSSKQAKILESQAESYKLLSRIYKSKGLMDESFNYLQKHAEIKDSILLKQLAKDQELSQKYFEIESKETQIKDLLIDKELKELQVRKLHLENDSKNKEWEILKRDNELRAISIREDQLKKEKELHLIILREQKYKMDAHTKQISLLQKQKEFEALNKQNKLKELNNNAKINALELEKQKVQLEKQSLIRNILIVIIILIPLFGFLIFRIYAYRQNAINNKLKHDALDLEQRMLRSQMNPHFIFNAMNSIQSFVSTNDSYSAAKYLARFSRLIRYILEKSSKEYVCFADEISILKLYIELEQLRFENKFTFSINVSPNIDTEYIFVPPMLIQPYIENAIVHGLCHRKGDNGILKVDFNLQDDVLICQIEDNGIGRELAQKLKQNKSEIHKSMGMQVTQERFKMLNQTHKQDYSSVVTDLYDDKLQSRGTLVSLRIAIQEGES